MLLCAVGLYWLGGRLGATRWVKWIVALCFVALWIPAGMAQLPLLAYVRGISSDLSVTSVVLACLVLSQRFAGLPSIERREHTAVFFAVAAAALFLYPLALGWGDWDPYRLGWGAPGFWAALLIVSLICWFMGLRLLPLLVALALLAWSAGLLESTNLWDYLVDPWLAIVALFQCVKTGTLIVATRFRGQRGNSIDRACVQHCS